MGCGVGDKVGLAVGLEEGSEEGVMLGKAEVHQLGNKKRNGWNRLAPTLKQAWR